MKQHQFACIFLLFMTIGMLYGASQMRGKANDVRKQAEAAENKARNADSERISVQARLTSLMRDTEDIREFYGAWLPYLESVRNNAAGESLVNEAVKNAQVFSISQRFEDANLDKTSVIPAVVRAHLEFEDEYSKTINALGLIEKALPTARTSHCEIRRGDSGNDINLRLTLEVPIFNPFAMTGGGSKSDKKKNES